jgi:hypothetical protein
MTVAGVETIEAKNGDYQMVRVYWLDVSGKPHTMLFPPIVLRAWGEGK